MDNRKFGVEIECGNINLHSTDIRNLLQEKDYTLEGALHPRGTAWSVGSDGSGIEVRTPPLQGAAGFKALRDVMNLLKESGCYVSEADGMHVHHDAPEFIKSKDNVIRLVRSWKNNDALISAFVAPDRRQNGCCPKQWLRDSNIKGLEEYLSDNYNVYGFYPDRGDLNVLSLKEHGTIEIRLHEGSLNPDEAEAWVKFGQRFIQSVLDRKRPLRTCKDAEALLKRLRAEKAASERLLAKARAGGLTDKKRKSDLYYDSAW